MKSLTSSKIQKTPCVRPHLSGAELFRTGNEHYETFTGSELISVSRGFEFSRGAPRNHGVGLETQRANTALQRRSCSTISVTGVAASPEGDLSRVPRDTRNPFL